MDIDLGDATLRIELKIPGRRRLGVRIHIGVPIDTTPADRVVNGPPYYHGSRKAGISMDLQADKQVPLTATWTDEVGNPTDTPPEDAAYTWTVDDPSIINLTDNGDGSATAAATGTLGTANVHLDATGAGLDLDGDLQIVVVSGLAERVSIVAGEPTEVTPDA